MSNHKLTNANVCPECNFPRCLVMNTKNKNKEKLLKRYRKCPKCGTLYKTTEYKDFELNEVMKNANL